MFPDKFSFFMFCLGCCLAFSQPIGKFQTSVAHERLERVNSNADQSNFLANKAVRHVLELCVIILLTIIHAKLFIEPCPLPGKNTEHYISKLV